MADGFSSKGTYRSSRPAKVNVLARSIQRALAGIATVPSGHRASQPELRALLHFFIFGANLTNSDSNKPPLPVSAPDEDFRPRSLIPFRMSQSELACVYAALILHDDGLEISVSNTIPLHQRQYTLPQAMLMSTASNGARLYVSGCNTAYACAGGQHPEADLSSQCQG